MPSRLDECESRVFSCVPKDSLTWTPSDCRGYWFLMNGTAQVVSGKSLSRYTMTGDLGTKVYQLPSRSIELWCSSIWIGQGVQTMEDLLPPLFRNDLYRGYRLLDLVPGLPYYRSLVDRGGQDHVSPVSRSRDRTFEDLTDRSLRSQCGRTYQSKPDRCREQVSSIHKRVARNGRLDETPRNL
jgi:hypothetical protein